MSRKDDQLPDETRARELAETFHATYELLAPQFGYETRADTKRFDADSLNGKLMVAVCRSILDGWIGERFAAGEKERDDLRAEVERLRTAMRDAASETGTSTLTHKILREALKEETKGE